MELGESKAGYGSRELQVQAANKYMELVKAGVPEAVAIQESGVNPNELLVRRRLAELAPFTQLNEEQREAIANAKLLEVLLQDGIDPRDAVAAARALKPNNNAPMVGITISDDLLKLKPTVFEKEKK